MVPGLGQIYNGQFGKGTFFSFIVLLSVLLLSAGVTFWVKGVPSFTKKSVEIAQSQEEQPVQMDESGVVIEDTQKAEKKQEKESIPTNIPTIPAVLTLTGLIGLLLGWGFAIKDAIKTAKLMNISYP